MAAVTMNDVIRMLLPDEADLHKAAAVLGPEALPHLAALVDGDDLMLAAKATYVAGLIPDPRGARIVQHAATKKERMVRLAAATVAQRMPAKRAGEIVITLLRDEDPEARQMAIEAVRPDSPGEVHAALHALAKNESQPYLRNLSEEVRSRMAFPSGDTTSSK